MSRKRHLAHYFEIGLDASEKLFVPLKQMWLLHEATKPAAVLSRAGLHKTQWNEWQRQFANAPWVCRWLYWARPEKRILKPQREVKRPLRPDEFQATGDMIRFRLHSSLSATIRDLHSAKLLRGVDEKQARKWLKIFKRFDWFEGWLLRGEGPPEDVRLPTSANVDACRAAWDYPTICKAVGTPQHVYQAWIEKLFPREDLGQWVAWLFGDFPPAGWYIVPRKIEQLHFRRSPAGIAKAANVRAVRWLYGGDQAAHAALAAAVEARRTNRSPESMPAWQQLFRSDGLSPANQATRRMMAGRMLAYAKQSTLSASLADVGLLPAAWRLEQRRAAEIGGESLKADLVAHVEQNHGPGINRLGVVQLESPDGIRRTTRLFVPSEQMMAFRAAAREAAREAGVASAESRLPNQCFRAWMLAVTVPQRLGPTPIPATPVANSQGTKAAGRKVTPSNHARDALATQFYQRGDILDAIKNRVNKQCESELDWSPFSSVQAVQAAIKRHAKREKIDLIERTAGRPKKYQHN